MAVLSPLFKDRDVQTKHNWKNLIPSNSSFTHLPHEVSEEEHVAQEGRPA